MNESQHIDSQYERELLLLRQEIVAMGTLVDGQVESALRALLKRDTHSAHAVIAEDRFTNQTERAIDEQCIRMLALRQPAASDLRFIASALKTVTDLERIGDRAANMAERALILISEEQLRAADDVPNLCVKARDMLHEALDAFVTSNAHQAEAVIAADREVDSLAFNLTREIQQEMTRDSQAVKRGLATITLVRDIERIADHATNIAEMVIYSARGQDVRHVKPAGGAG